MVRDMTRPLRVAAADDSDDDSDDGASDGDTAQVAELKGGSSPDTHAHTPLSPRRDSSPSLDADAREDEGDVGEQEEVDEEREEDEGESPPRSVDGDARQDLDERWELRERLKQERLQQVDDQIALRKRAREHARLVPTQVPPPLPAPRLPLVVGRALESLSTAT